MGKNLNQQQLFQLSQLVVENWEKLMVCLNISMYKGKTAYVSRCFIHDGDNTHALSLYHDHDRCSWRCYTQHCEKIFLDSPIGLIRGILSKQKYNWSEENDRKATFGETIDFIQRCLKCDLSDIAVNQTLVEQYQFIKNSAILSKPPKVRTSTLTREKFRAKAGVIPAPYFVDRGFDPNILNKYDIALCTDPKFPLFNRCIVPIYDTKGEFVIATTNRSIFPKCEICKTYHNPTHRCPYKNHLYLYAKWKHSEDFKAQKNLYNYWYAVPAIKGEKIVVIVESPGNVWKLEECGIHTSLATFGSNFSEDQFKLLNKTGAVGIIVVGDNDEAGQKFNEQVIKMCKNLYKIWTFIPDTEYNDLGGTPVDIIKTNFLSLYNSAKNLISSP